MSNGMRSHYCGDIRAGDIDNNVAVCGWIQVRRDHGGVIFLDVRDREGLVQLVYEPDNQEVFDRATNLRNEYVIRATGKVRHRGADKINPRLATGEVEILGETLEILNSAGGLPFTLDEYSSAGEDIRLRYRYLDLRRPEMQKRLFLRSKIASTSRTFLESEGFVEVETPTLTKSTPEGARDYLVPSRKNPGHFFALPQSPQLFKQVLMISGFDRYYQIARCYRDEDLRHDRQPEFTQIDIEASFVDEFEVMRVTEGLLRSVFEGTLGIDLGDFPVLTYSDAMERYGSDKPDLRIPLLLAGIDDLVRDLDFNVLARPARDENGRVSALRVPGGVAKLSRREIDALVDFARDHGAEGLAYIKVNDISQGMAGLQSSILKFVDEPTIRAVLEKCKCESGDILFVGAGHSELVGDFMGALRVQVGHQLGLAAQEHRACWVVDWPMFERTSDGNYTPAHHPFTRPSCSLEEFASAPHEAKAKAYDIVLDGYELGGGSLRIHDVQMQRAVFDALGMGQEADVKFGFLLDALEMGCPPHGGIALGLDRLAMIVAGADSVREVIAFPKTLSATCPLTSAPSTIDVGQMRELHLDIRGRK